MLDRKTVENLYWLFNDSSQLSFSSYKEEMAFWSREEICERINKPANPRSVDYGMREKEILPSILSGKSDIVKEGDGDCTDPGPRYFGYRLRSEFSKHSERVRLLSNRFWVPRLRKQAA